MGVISIVPFAMDTDTAHTTYDWGYSLLPEDVLTEMVLGGWMPGSSDLTANGSPLWVTANADTTLYVDYDGDASTGALVDPYGRRYDLNFSLGRLESLRLYDTVNADNDQTGTRIYTLDGTDLAAAWGQDPATAGTGSPFLDMGTVLLPFPLPTVTKDVAITTDLNNNNAGDPGDTLTWTITVTNNELFSLGSPVVYDTVPANTTYVAGSTWVNGVNVVDDTVGTPIPLDEGGYALPTILPGQTATVTFQTTLNPFAPVYTGVTNTVIVDSSIGTSGATVPLVVNTVGPTIDLDGNDSTTTGSDYIGTFTEDAGAVPIYDFVDDDAAITDPDSSYLTEMTITFTDPQSDDVMSFIGSLPAGVTIASQTATQIVLGGTALMSDYLTALQNVRFENTSQNAILGDRHFTVDTTDGTFNSNTATATISVQRVNDQPVWAGLDNTPNFTEGSTAVVLDGDATISDIELDDIDNYNGATLTFSRNGGANADDVFGASGTLGTLAQSGIIDLGGVNVGTVTTNSAGTLLLTFNANATAARVDQVIQQITYSNSSDAPPANVTIDFLFGDGNTGTQGIGGVETGIGSITVSITPTPDTPVAVDDTDTTDEDTVLNVAAAGVLSNDYDPDIETLTVVGHDSTSALGATVVVNADGSFSYDPTSALILQSLSPGQSLVDTFTYTIEDPTGLQDTATVSITVTGVDDGLSAFDDAATTNEDAPVTVSAPGVLINDSDPDSGVPTGTTLNYDAKLDQTNDGIWQNTTGFGGFDITLDASVSRNTPSSSYPGITESFQFNGSAGGTFSSFAESDR